MKSKFYRALVAVALCVFILVVYAVTRGERALENESGENETVAGQQLLPDPKNDSIARHPAPQKQATSSKSVTDPARAVQAKETPVKPDGLASFDLWLENYLSADSAGRRELLSEGLVLAELRKQVMENLIRTDPESALAFAVTYYEYEQLPDELKAHVERPFTERVNVVLIPDHTGSGSGPVALLETTNGGYQSRQLFLYGQRRGILSKKGIAAQGIILGNTATLKDYALQEISTAADLAWASQHLTVRNPDSTKDFLTGEPITDEPVAALAGGHLFYFANRRNVQLLNAKLAEMEKQIGPEVGSQILFVNEMAVGEQGDSLAQIVLQDIPVAAGTWTETRKDVFFIRIDFSDKPGASVSKPDLLAELNGDVTASIDEYSYGKTWIEADVSDAVVRVPQVSVNYLPGSNYSILLNDAKTAFNALGTGINLNDYDIVGIHFADIGYLWAGLASVGWGNIWIKNTLSTRVIVHELGHNYGLRHANYWDTGGASVVGTGASVEYGDIFDNMGGAAAEEGHYHIQGKALLNWLPSSQVAQLNGAADSGTFRVYRFDHRDGSALNQQALRIYKGDDEYYWLGYRLKITNNNWLQNGAYLIWERPGYAQSWLIDTTPGSADGKNDAGVPIGATYSDTTANVYITPIAKGGSSPDEWLDVTVNIGDFSSNNDPTVTISGPASPAVRTSVLFTASGGDIDGDNLVYFWDFGDGIFHESTDSISHTWAVGGTYTVSVTANDMKGGTATDQVTVVVDDPLTKWNSRATGSTRNLYDIASNGPQVLAVGQRYAFISADGASWTDTGSVGTNVTLYGLVYDSGLWVGVGMDYDYGIADWVGAIYTSTDGSTWINRLKGGLKLRDIAANGSVFVAVGNDGVILRSTDGINWVPQTSGTVTSLRGVAYGNGIFTAVGSVSSGGSVVVLTSTGGVSWFDHSAGAGLASWQGFDSIEYLNDRFAASGWYAKIRHSVDNGKTFITNRTVTEDTPAFAYGNSVYFAAGGDKSNGADIDLASMDGVTWHTLTTPSLNDRNSAIFFNNTFITVGQGGSIRQSDPVVDPSCADDDRDGLCNSVETNTGIFVDVDNTGSNPNNPDSDSDTINDGDEVNTYGTDPNSTDSDSDGIDDKWEIDNSLDPNVSNAGVDTDSDGYADLVEYQNGTDPNIQNDPYTYPNYNAASDDRDPYQLVSTDPIGPTGVAGASFNLDVNYDTSDSNNTLSGFGLRIHYDSTKLTWNSFSNVLDDLVDDVVVDAAAQDDTADFDNDANTDKYLEVTWSDGGDLWPNVALPSRLYTVRFDVVGTLNPAGTSTIRFSAGSSAAAYSFYADPVIFTVESFNADIDDNGSEDALTDGLLILRNMFGFTGSTLIDGAVGIGAARLTAAEIEAYIAIGMSSQALDVDGNGSIDALTDGLLILRYMFGFTGSTLIDGAVGIGATRTTAAEIETYLADHI